tara:strand:- start:9437 stop:9943 length:507 start_codon:yes stop_codon:yes gene_type:complete
MDLEHIKIGRRMFVIGSDREFYAEYGAQAGYNNFLNNLTERGIELVPVRRMDPTESVLHQVVQNGEIILRDNSEFLYEAHSASLEQLTQLREAAKIYGLEYEIDVIIEHIPDSAKVVPPINQDQFLSDSQLNKFLWHDGGNHFKLDVYKDADIVDGKIIKPKKDGKKL